MSGTQATVAIVGAGVAGLAAAERLLREDFHVTVIEARPRIGGRIETQYDFASSPIERGAEFVHGRHPGLVQRIDQAGLHLVRRPFEPLVLQDGKASRPTWSWETIFKELANPDAPDAPIGLRIGELLRSGQWSETDARRLRRYVEGYMAADVERVSARALSEETRAANDLGDDGNASIREGYDALVRHLGESLSCPAATLLLAAAVRRIRWLARSVTLHAERSDGLELSPIVVERAIVTVPLGILQLPEDHAGAIRFEPAIEKTLVAARRLAMGNVVKLFLRLRCALAGIPGVPQEIRKQLDGPRFLQTPAGPVPTWWQTGDQGAPVLVGWAGGPIADNLSRRTEQQIIDAGIETLSHALDVPSQNITSCIEAATVTDWNADPWARGAYSWIPAGALDAPAILAAPVDETLFFAGEATDTSGYRGTVHGALDTGIRAAEQVIASL